MFNARPPFKLAVAETFLDESLTASEAAALLAPLYPGERRFTPADVASAVLALKAVGILRPIGEKDGESLYAVTPAGRRKVLSALGKAT